MFDLECEKCGGMIQIDEYLTAEEYGKDMDYLVDEVGHLVESTIQKYLVYRCISCDATYRFTYKDWEKHIRVKVAKIAMDLRKQKMFAEDINPMMIDPDNGLEYCGQCDGYDGEGNCLVDIIKQCTIRKDK
jgi:hypothetical protein